jgi:hypothetical protein
MLAAALVFGGLWVLPAAADPPPPAKVEEPPPLPPEPPQGQPVPPTPSVSVCPSRFSEYRFTSAELSCHCYSSAMTGSVWGTGPYTDDSSICAAALHAGVVRPEGGPVSLRWAHGQSSYPGSRRNGVSSSRWDRWDGSFVFTSPVVVHGGVVQEDRSCGSADTYRGSREVVTCVCRPEDMSGTVWGSGPYTDDSSICLAAVHAGVIGRSGGTVSFQAQPGRRSFSGSYRNGVETTSYGRWDGSFRFVR